jgi:hypothetical protein
MSTVTSAPAAAGKDSAARPDPPRERHSGGPGPCKKLAAALGERSREAKQRAAAILEVLGGGRTPTQAAQALSVSLARYYLLEDRALAALVTACEPQPRGPGANDNRRLVRLERECERWQRECARQQALVRASQRTIGLAPPPAPVKDKTKRRRRKPVVRALAAASRLRQPAPAELASTVPPPAG